jgi:hypothetical protein
MKLIGGLQKGLTKTILKVCIVVFFSNISVLAIEISIASDPVALSSLSEKISQKLSSDSVSALIESF